VALGLQNTVRVRKNRNRWTRRPHALMVGEKSSYLYVARWARSLCARHTKYQVVERHGVIRDIWLSSWVEGVCTNFGGCIVVGYSRSGARVVGGSVDLSRTSAEKHGQWRLIHVNR
jgi:hypothetical protein